MIALANYQCISIDVMKLKCTISVLRLVDPICEIMYGSFIVFRLRWHHNICGVYTDNCLLVAIILICRPCR
jgi:hypothetical protein